ncbi:MAG: Methyltransferase type 11 [Candidatus Moranbacteria bacterium GW2011_GWC2_37_8]|nr:MAG: Methyltransferase type 11 [Candidatus Moranbacteria bacterium GW2011_GWC2_37_8]KKQ63357.1 MAG: Methyltransferase type 11 [Parcubacteria group bacterium GW2011_GWC1_38_22]
MNKKNANRILLETESGYDLISEKFSQTRKHFWRGLELIKDYTHDGDNVLDYGCGNGRLLELVGDKDIQYYGADVSQELINWAQKKYVGPNIKFSKLDPIQSTLAFEDNFFNTIYSIAVFHHFPSKKYRTDIARQLYRLTADGGHVIVTVWYLWQRNYFKNISRVWIQKLKGETELDWNDCMISFTDNEGKKFERFHHAFTKRELRRLFSNAGFKIERCSIPDGRNILLVGRKG